MSEGRTQILNSQKASIHGRWLAWLVGAALLIPLFVGLFPVTPVGGQQVSTPEIPFASLLDTVLVACAAATLAVIVGGAFALLFGLAALPGRNLAATLLLLPLLAPATVWTLQQMYCYGAGGLVESWLGDAWAIFRNRLNRGNYLATVLVLAQIQAPLAMLLVGRAVDRFEHAGWEAARFFLRPGALFIWTTRAVRPELTTTWLLSFALGLGNFAVPHVLQCRLYPIEIYMQATNYLNHAAAVRLAWPLVMLALLSTTLAVYCERRDYSLSGPSRPMAQLELGRWKWPILLAGCGYLVVTTLLPLAALARACRSPADFLAAVQAAAPETQNSLWIAIGVGAIACCAGMALGSLVRTRANMIAEWLAILPLAVPPLVVALAYATLFNRDWPIDLTWVGNHSGLVILGLATRSLPFAARIAAGGQRGIAPAWDEAIRLAGVSTLRRWWWVTWPLMVRHAAAAFLVAAVLSLGEVEISQMLCGPGSGTLALRLFTFLHFGPEHVAASLASLQLSLALLPVIIYFLLTNRCPQVI